MSTEVAKRSLSLITLVVPWSMDFNLTDRAAFRGTVLPDEGRQSGRDGHDWTVLGTRRFTPDGTGRNLRQGKAHRQTGWYADTTPPTCRPFLRRPETGQPSSRSPTSPSSLALDRRSDFMSQENRLELYIESQWDPVAQAPPHESPLELIVECDLHEMICSRTICQSA